MINMKTNPRLATSILILATPLAIAATAPLPHDVLAHKHTMRGAYSKSQGTVLAEVPRKLIETWRSLCPATQKRALVLTGPQSSLGTLQTDTYFSKDKTASYTTAYHLIAEKDDPCAMRIETKRTALIVTFDGQRSSIIRMDMTKRVGKKTIVAGRSPLLSTSDAIDQAGSIAGATTQGRDTVASLSCDIKRIETRGGITELCLLADPKADPSLHGIPLKVVRTSLKGQQISSSEVTSFQSNIQIDTGVFEATKNIQILDSNGLKP